MQSVINKIVGSVFAIINLMWIINYARLFYRYRFSVGIVFLVMYPDWFLVVNVVIGIIGLCISILLFMNKLRMKFFLIIEIILLLIGYFIYQ